MHKGIWIPPDFLLLGMHRIFLFLFLGIFSACHRTKSGSDEFYSRHLQRSVQLKIIHTPLPEDRRALHLLIINDGQEFNAFRVKEIVDSLFQKGMIQPLVVVGIEAGDRMQEYGVAGRPDYQQRGSKAGDYDAFINDELYPYAKKMAGVRKFLSVTMAGCSLGGLSAFDIAWNHPDKIDRVGVFSGSFWWRDKSLEDSSYSDLTNRILYSKVKASRKKPGLHFWFYVGGAEETADRDKDGITDAVDDTRDLIDLLKSKNISAPGDISYIENKAGHHDYETWTQFLPAFLIWAVGKSN